MLFSYGCIDVIELKVRENEPHRVFEAIVDITDSICYVKTSQSVGLYERDIKKFVPVFRIELKNKSKNLVFSNFRIVGDSMYFCEKIIGEKGDVFEISILDTNDVKYTATAVTPDTVPYFLIVFKKIPNLFNDKGQQAHYGLAYWIDYDMGETFYKFEIYRFNWTLYNDNFNFVSDQFAINDTMQLGLRSLFF